MNCVQFRTYLSAFADGELSVEANLEALEHLNMCPDCAARTVDIQSLKVTLREVWPETPAPEGLRQRISAALDSEVAKAESPQTDSARGGVIVRRSAPGFLARHGLVAPLAVAAALAFSVIAWRLWPGEQIKPGTMTVVWAQAVADVRDQHLHCVGHMGDRHHDESLGRDVSEVEARLSERLGIPVRVPDLTNHGFRFIGADRCGIRGRAGAHALYRSPESGQSCSVFTVALMPELDVASGRRIGGRSFFVSIVKDTHVLAWHEGGYTYVVCVNGDIAEDSLLAMARDM